MKRHTNGKRWIVGLLGVMLALCLVPVAANATGGTEGEPAPQADGAVAKIGDREYTSIDDAVEEAAEGSTIELLQNCEMTKGFNKTLTFTGNGKISINRQLTSNGEGWMCFGLYDPSRVLTFDGAGVSVEWVSEVGTSPWLMLSLSGTLNVTNGAKVSFTVDSGSTGSRNAIYMNSGSSINVTKGSTFEIHGNGTAGKEGQGIQLDKAGTAKINVTGGSTFLIDGTNRGYVNNPSIYVENSTFTVQNCTANASNGGDFVADNSSITYAKNAGHGLSASNVTIRNHSTFNATDNGYYGAYSSGKFSVDGTSTLNITGNSGRGDFAGLKLTKGVTAGLVESGAIVNITDNYCSGLSNNGKVTFEEGAKLTITGNLNDKGTSSHGGGIYNSGDAANLTLPSDAVIYNNHAVTDGDDIFNNTTATISFGSVGSDWKLDGTGIGGAADDCTDAIDGWYDDSADARWEAHTSPVHAVKQSAGTVHGLTALKAAHGLTPLDPTDPELPEWTTSKSKTATQLDENYESNVTLSLPAAEEELVSDVVFVLDKSTSQDKQNAAIDMLESLKGQIADTGAKVKVGVVVFNKEAHNVLELTELNDGSMAAIEEAIRYDVSSGTNTHAGLLAGVKMLDEDTSVEDARKYLVFVSDGITYMYNESPTAISLQNGDKTNAFAGPDNWSTKYGTNEAPSDWNEWLGVIGAQIEADGTTYDGPYEENNNFIAWDERENHAMSIDKALYLTYQAYQDAASKYHCYTMTAESSAAADHPWASSFMSFLANGKQVSFDEIQNDIYYLLDKGSSVVDVIGYGTDNLGADYNFDFVNSLDNLNLTVGGKTLDKEALASDKVSADVNATSAYGFGKKPDGSYDFELWYYEKGQDGNSDECFVWEINVPVSNFAPVQLTYTVKLTNPSYLEGTHGTFDATGENQYDGLLTNTVATLYPVDSNGGEGMPENFYRPTVSYEVGSVTVRPAEMTIYMGGNQGYDTVVSGSGDSVVAESTNSLPEPGFYIDLSEDLNELLRDAQGTDNPGATDLSDLITFRTVSDDREWKFERYGGEAGSTAYDQFVYRLVPAAGQQPIRLEFTSEDGSTHFTSDDFDPMVEGALYNEYSMGIYAGNVNLNQILMDITIDGKTYTKVVNVETSTLNIRYVVDTENGNPVTGVVNDINDAENPGVDAYAVTSSDATFYINGSQIDIARDAAPSLLFDSLVSTESGADENHFDSKLLAKATDAVAAQDESFQITGHESKYLDLVDANNGNAWLMTDSPVTVYWPYPEGTDENTEFHLTHFQGLDRDMANDEVDGEIDATEPEYISVTNTEHGVMFTLQPKQGDDGLSRVRFSPFVLVWGESDEGPTGPTGPTGGETDTPQKPTDKPADTTKPAGPEIPETGDPTTVVSVATLLVAGVGTGAAGVVMRRRRR